jgi:hypothetical protein
LFPSENLGSSTGLRGAGAEKGQELLAPHPLAVARLLAGFFKGAAMTIEKPPERAVASGNPLPAHHRNKLI